MKIKTSDKMKEKRNKGNTRAEIVIWWQDSNKSDRYERWLTSCTRGKSLGTEAEEVKAIEFSLLITY